MQLLRDLALAVAVVLSAFAVYDTRIKPIYVCDINALVSEYTMALKDAKLSYREKQERLEDFMYRLREVLNQYGTVYKKGIVVGKNIKDITPEVRAELFGVSRYMPVPTNQR